MMLSEINIETQSDKGTYHTYIDMYYEKVMSNYKKKTISLLEIGVNTGNSLELWGKYFNNESTIMGVDKKATNYTPSKKNMRYIIGDATKPETFYGLNNIDIIIDDGSHKIKHQINSFKLLYSKLTESGMYIIEDVKDIDSTIQQFKNLEHQYGVAVKIFDFRSLKDIKDDVIVEIKK